MTKEEGLKYYREHKADKNVEQAPSPAKEQPGAAVLPFR